jgi:hypothetical protein
MAGIDHLFHRCFEYVTDYRAMLGFMPDDFFGDSQGQPNRFRFHPINILMSDTGYLFQSNFERSSAFIDFFLLCGYRLGTTLVHAFVEGLFYQLLNLFLILSFGADG